MRKEDGFAEFATANASERDVVPVRPGGQGVAAPAVTPDGVASAVADTGGCGVVDKGVRKVTNKALVRELAG
jgi:hypothetical protein